MLALVLVYFRTSHALLRALLLVFLGIVVPIALFVAFWTPFLVVVLEGGLLEGLERGLTPP